MKTKQKTKVIPHVTMKIKKSSDCPFNVLGCNHPNATDELFMDCDSKECPLKKKAILIVADF